ncbi:MAG: Multi-sensor signal transduction histidine kinase [Parcubacteria group bacterium Gr01-1014_18]|nr:MAG: Multi-sensor signal transduction histidine kinase [Parcubacteria group bacterium Greene0416_36]TSC79749.1 MAG: Multi-sensor signal transduction histidine kinase [Parcubacteria group bacterium Gr01-1014_18]TSC97915.1 MAG: Multi-sensor signal transduction histidine kinase [Parcubacteria group bacterium Greene1014_20]TSD06573.1 MAG: Multi-sensor signal transduction histidine kinase [Parcubacteria group bacterium Greene0714_2]
MLSETGKSPNHNATKKATWHWPIFAVLSLIILPLILAAFYVSFQTFRELHNFTLSRREGFASLAAIMIKEKFDRVIDVGISLSTRVRFQELVEAGKWDEAIKIMEDVPKNFQYIDTVALFDTTGTVWAVTPLTLEIAPLIGKDFSSRDYYQGIAKNWEPYVSEVFKRAPKPQYKVVSIAIPIKSDKILGILLLTIKLDAIVAWSKNIDVGPAGFVYIVDRKGHLAAHPTLSAEGDIVDYFSVPTIQRVLKGEQGVEVLFNPIENEERITAYAPVPDYGWGAIVVQPTRIAFIERNRAVGRVAAIWTLAIFVVGFFTYRLLRDRSLIKAQRDRESTLLRSIGDGVFSIDRYWNITQWNKAAERITGWTEEEVLEKPFRNFVKFIREHDWKENITFIEEAMLYGKVYFMESNTVLMKKDGQEMPVGDCASPIFDEKGQVIGAIIIFRDVSAEREAKRMRSDFTYASHQLRTPVNRALWSLEIALEEKRKEAIIDKLSVAYISLKSVAKLVEGLLIVSDIDQRTILPSKENLRLLDMMDEVTRSLAQEAEKKGVALIIEPISTALGIFTDKKLFTRILFELIQNAILYSGKGSKVVIRTISQAEGILVEINDFGIGIPSEQQALIFTKFFRGQNVPEDSVGGGLGLFIAKETIQILGGKIWFKSEQNKGTTFYLSLPA